MDDIQFIRKLGEGGFGCTWLVEKDNQQYAMKTIELQGKPPNTREWLRRETQALRSLCHPNIVKYEGSIERNEMICILMEFCDGGDMRQSIRTNKRNGTRIPESEIRHCTVLINNALQYIHDKGYIHRDLKPDNIFLTNSGGLKIGDFGLARKIDQQFYLNPTHCGTAIYTAPEVVNRQRYNAKADMWSFGCIIYELAKLETSYPYTNLTIPANYSNELKSLIKCLLKQDPNQRLSAAQVAQHPFVNLQNIRIVVKDVNDVTQSLSVSLQSTVLDVKRKISSSSGVAPENLRLAYQGRSLRDNQTMQECGVDNGATLQMMVAYQGGFLA